MTSRFNDSACYDPKHCRNAFLFLRNEAGTDVSKIRGTGKGTVRSFSVPFASKFDENFAKISQIFRNYPQYMYFTVYGMKVYYYKFTSVKNTKGEKLRFQHAI